MKTKLYLLLFVMAVLFASCQSEDESAPSADELVNISFDLGGEFSVEDAMMTRAVSSTFDYYYIAVTSEDGADGTFSSGYAGYFSSLSGVSLSLPKGTYNFHISAFKSEGYTIDWATVNAGLVQGQFAKVASATEYAPAFADNKLDRYYGSVNKEITTNTVVTVEGKRFSYGINVDIEKPLEGKVVLSCASPAFSYTVTSTGTAVKESNIFSMAGTDPETASKTMDITMTMYDASNNVIKTQTKTITVARNHSKTIKVKTLDPTVYFDFYVSDGDMSEDGEVVFGGSLPEQEAVHEYVDLDLPSGTLWATCNVGANAPEEYGGYYAWGETKAYGEEDITNSYNYSYGSTYTKTCYTWETNKWFKGSSYNTLTKYNTSSSYGIVDNKTTLEFADDAAYVNWGKNWRMPTHAEMQELHDNCTWIWDAINGVDGYKVISKKDSSKFIFLPAAGYRSCDSIINTCTQGHLGVYWTRLLGTDYPFEAGCLGFRLDFINPNGNQDRCLGQSVRPVRRQ